MMIKPVDFASSDSHNIELSNNFKTMLYNRVFSKESIDAHWSSFGYHNPGQCLSQGLMSVQTKKFHLTIPHLS